MDSIWWRKVTNASRFLDMIIEEIQEGQSILLELPADVPWYRTMRDLIETELIRQNSTSEFRYIVDSGEEPGEYLFQKFCKKEKQAHYRPGIGYAEFLAKSEDILLQHCILWISGLDKEQMKRWYSFLEGYLKALGKQQRGAVFLLESREETGLSGKKGIKKHSYRKEIEHYDNYLFNMLAVSGLKENELFKQYLAEAVSILLQEDMELASYCISYGRKFLAQPWQTLEEIAKEQRRSDGTDFQVRITASELQERLWEAQIKVIFPLLEKHRNKIIQNYQREIEALLPLNAAYGESFEEANEVELGVISYLAASGKLQMSYEDSCQVAKLKDARNTLAHLKTLRQEEVDEIFAM